MSQTKDTLTQLAKSSEAVAQHGLEEARKIGADAKIHTRISLQKKLVCEAGEFTLANSQETQKLSIAIYKDQKKGSATINALDEGSIKQAVSDAASLAQFSLPDPNLTMADKEQAPTAKPLSFMWNDTMAEMSLETMHGAMAEGLARVTRDKRVALDRFELSVDVSSHGLYNTNGVKQSEKQTMANWVYFGMARDGDQVSTFDYDGNFTLDAAMLQSDLLRDAESFEKAVLQMLNPRKCPSYKGPVLLTPRAVQGLLMGTVFFHTSGRQIMDGKSSWADSLDKQVASSALTIIDRPHDPQLSGCTSFDGDGLPTVDHTFIDRGILKTHALDCYSAKKLGRTSNACNGAPFGIQIAAGDTALQDLAKDHKSLLVVDRFSGNTDPLKGDFSGVAKASRLWQNGEDQGAVTETMIAGNVMDLLNAIIGISKEVQRPFGSFSSPHILVDGVSVTGQG